MRQQVEAFNSEAQSEACEAVKTGTSMLVLLEAVDECGLSDCGSREAGNLFAQ
jgi:hypothetical protein